MTSTVKRSVPPTLVKMGNPLVRMLLGSPRHGCLRPMHALLDEDPASVAVSYRAMIDRIGQKKAQRQLGISLPGRRAPTALELKDAAREYGWSVITLTPR